MFTQAPPSCSSRSGLGGMRMFEGFEVEVRHNRAAFARSLRARCVKNKSRPASKAWNAAWHNYRVESWGHIPPTHVFQLAHSVSSVSGMTTRSDIKPWLFVISFPSSNQDFHYSQRKLRYGFVMQYTPLTTDAKRSNCPNIPCQEKSVGNQLMRKNSSTFQFH